MEENVRDRIACAERALAARLDTRYCVLTGSFSHACKVALSALCARTLGERAILPLDEIILPAVCDIALLSAVVACGAVPVFVDVNERDLTLDVTQLERALSPRTRAVVAQHMPAGPFDVRTVRNFCNKYDLWMIENAATMCDATYDFDGTPYALGTVGDVGVARLASLAAFLTRDTLLASLAREAREPYALDADAVLTLDTASLAHEEEVLISRPVDALMRSLGAEYRAVGDLRVARGVWENTPIAEQTANVTQVKTDGKENGARSVVI